MTAFSEPPSADDARVEFEPTAPAPPKRPPRWSPSNWPVAWKVFAIVLVPLALAATFGGLRIYSSATEAADLRDAADRAEMVPAIESYMAALEDAMLASSTGVGAQQAMSTFDSRSQELEQKLAATEAAPADVQEGVTAMLDGGQTLLQQVATNAIDLRGRVTAFAPILLTAEDAISGSVRVDSEEIRSQAIGLSRAVGARGQMTMQQLLVNLGAQVPPPELRNSMITLAGTEPSTLFGMNQVLGVGSQDAQTLQNEMVTRMAVMSDPASVLVNNPQLLASLQTTEQIAGQVIDDTGTAVTTETRDIASAERSAVIREAVIVGVAILLALVVVTLVAGLLVRPLRKLRDSALKVAHDDLSQELERVRTGGEPVPIDLMPVQTTEEVGQVAHAVDELHEHAVFIAGEQARLQLQMGDMFETLSRRSRSLVDQQLSLIDRLESNEEDPQRLESLFRLDHLAARMRRNGANLLVLAGAKVPRDTAEPVAVATVINAAASEVEDYNRVVTATVPESEIVGSAAGDLVHLLAELLDNALRYSPPISQVRVSGVHTGNGGLVIEVSDIGLGMTEPDLRVANTRLQSGGEVNPYTARHMGLFVVGRLAAQHGLVVRLRHAVEGEPNSGTTAGVYMPAELMVRDGEPQQPAELEEGTPTDARAGIATALALDQAHGDTQRGADDLIGPEHLNGHAEVPPVAVLPQRSPGASGISDIPTALARPAAEQGDDGHEDDWPEDSMPAQTPAEPPAMTEQPEPSEPSGPSAPSNGRVAPSDTSAFFASRAQVVGNGVPDEPHEPQPSDEPAQPTGRHERPDDPAHADAPSPRVMTDDAIYQSMLSEWLVDPTELANSSDLNWKSVWDHGWSAAAAAEEAPVHQHTDEGLPMREPGVRLVPGAAEFVPEPTSGRHRNGGAHRSGDDDDQVASSAEAADESDADPEPMLRRDPDAVRVSINNHFGGVHAARTHARESRGTDNE